MTTTVTSENRYVALVQKASITAFNIGARDNKPCRSYAKYQGKRSPQCVCMPCLDRYLEIRKAKGEQVVTMSPGWRPA
jgi:hypothetical protein